MQLREGKLRATIRGLETAELLPESEATFFCLEPHIRFLSEVTFTKNPAGLVSGLKAQRAEAQKVK